MFLYHRLRLSSKSCRYLLQQESAYVETNLLNKLIVCGEATA